MFGARATLTKDSFLFSFFGWFPLFAFFYAHTNKFYADSIIRQAFPFVHINVWGLSNRWTYYDIFCARARYERARTPHLKFSKRFRFVNSTTSLGFALCHVWQFSSNLPLSRLSSWNSEVTANVRMLVLLFRCVYAFSGCVEFALHQRVCNTKQSLETPSHS